MAIGAVLLMLAAAQWSELAAPAEPPREPLVCRYESVVSRLIARRKLCLPTSEWDKRSRENDEAARRSLYELMGNTACIDGGLCTIE